MQLRLHPIPFDERHLDGQCQNSYFQERQGKHGSNKKYGTAATATACYFQSLGKHTPRISATRPRDPTCLTTSCYTARGLSTARRQHCPARRLSRPQTAARTCGKYSSMHLKHQPEDFSAFDRGLTQSAVLAGMFVNKTGDRVGNTVQ